jgi:AraC family transcriptional regulator, arabinose operon regulatory protein
MQPELKGRSIWFSIPIFAQNESISSPRYRHTSDNRGDDPFVIVQWTQSGEGLYTNEKGTFKVPPGYAFIAIIPEKSSYHFPPKSKVPWVFDWFNVYGSSACEIFRIFRGEFGHIVPLPLQGPAATAFRRLLATLSNPEGANRWQVSIDAYSFVLEWWREASQAGSPEDGLDRAMRFCREHFREQLSVKQIAYETNMSREHFTRSFSQRFKETPGGVLRELRLKEAGILLRETRLSLGEVAARSGFYSVRHLVRTFQRTYGKSPSQFRGRGSE